MSFCLVVFLSFCLLSVFVLPRSRKKTDITGTSYFFGFFLLLALVNTPGLSRGTSRFFALFLLFRY